MSLIAVGKIVNVHGIKGAVKIKPFLLNKTDLTKYNPLTDKTGKKHFQISIIGQQGECLLASIDGIKDRNLAENFKGLELYTDRNNLPTEKNGEFYICDLIGLNVFKDNEIFGVVTQVLNHGAGDILQIKTTHGISEFIFSKENFPIIDIANKKIQIVLPEDMKEIIK